MRYLLSFFILVLSYPLLSQHHLEQSEILKLFPSAKVYKRDAKDHFIDQYEIKFKQALDHKDPSKGFFEHRIFLSHYDTKASTVIITDGYASYLRTSELAKILKANQIIVEFRFFGASAPTPILYEFLTNAQAMDDLHEIRKKIGKLYKKKWISTGISKGGTTTMYYKATYPKDVCVAVPYVGPLPFDRVDSRMDTAFFNNIGTQDCRNRISEFQLKAIEYRDSIIDQVKILAQAKGYDFSRLGIEKAVEYSILEYPFSFWQMGHNCNDIPIADTFNDIYRHLQKVVGIEFYSNNTIKYFEPSFYQFMTENGYYGFVHDHLEGKLRYIEDFTNYTFAPNGTPAFDSSYNMWVKHRLDKKGKRMIIIHGALDPWAAVAYRPIKSNNLFIKQEDGDHGTSISNLSDENKNAVYQHLEKWLKVPIHRLN